MAGAINTAQGRGRTERARSARGQAHRPDLRKVYDREMRDVTPGDYEFMLELIRGRGVATLVLDDVVENFDWTDEAAVLTGNVTLRRPDPEDPGSLPIGAGHQIRCLTRSAGRWYEVWQMRVQTPPSVDPIDGTLDVELKDDLDLLARNRRDWSFRKTQHRGRGWFAHEIAREVARREGVRLGQVARGTVRINKLVMKGKSGLDVIKEAYGREREETGRRFIIRMRKGRLEVIPLRRNKILYIFRDEFQEALLTGEQKARPVTLVHARGRIGKGSDAETIRSTVYRRAIVRRYGHVSAEHDFGRVVSRAQLRRKATRWLADQIRVKRAAEVTLPGVPFIRRGDGARWINGEPGWHGPSRSSRDRTFVYCTRVAHQVASGGDYSMSVSFIQEDPYVADQKRRDQEMREKKAKK